MLHILDNKKYVGVIYDIILTSLKQWDLNLEKFVGFGSNGVAVILDSCYEVATKVKKKINHFLLSIYCIAH